jgi:putative hydrolase of the HAD superfamily
MTEKAGINTLFLDIGGVLLTNGWDGQARSRAIKHFKLEADEVNEKHHLTFDTYELGKLTLDEYLDKTIFYRKRQFSRDEFKSFMFDQSRPYPDMIDLILSLKSRYHLTVFAVSNEGRELTRYRVETFGLRDFIDAFVVSSFVRFRKPDPDILRLALDMAQSAPQDVLYIEDRALYVEIARDLQINAIHHESFKTTKKYLEKRGLTLPPGKAEASRQG